MLSNQGQNNEIQSDSTDLSNTQPSNWQGPKQRSLVISACVPFATFRSNLSSGLNCCVHSQTGFESVTSTKNVSYTTFALLVCESVTFTTQVSCNTFASLVCAPVTSTNQILQDKPSSTFQLVVASVHWIRFLLGSPSAKAALKAILEVQASADKTKPNNASSFDDKTFSTFQLVVASVDWKSKSISSLGRIKANSNLQTTNDFRRGSPSHFSPTWNPTFKRVQTVNKSHTHIVEYS